MAKQLTKDIQKRVKKDKEAAMIKELDDAGQGRLRWEKLRWMKKDYTPTPFHIKTQEGRAVKWQDQAVAQAALQRFPRI